MVITTKRLWSALTQSPWERYSSGTTTLFYHGGHSAETVQHIDLLQTSPNLTWATRIGMFTYFITTFQTQCGRYRWKTVPFGTSVSSELFQKWLDQALKGLSDVIKVSDVIILYGEGDDINSSAADRDKNLKTLVEKCRTAGMKFNR